METEMQGLPRTADVRSSSQEELVSRKSDSSLRRHYERNHLAFVPAINPKIAINRDHPVFWIQFAHSNKTEISQIRLPIGIALGQRHQLRQVSVAIERKFD